MSWRDLIPEKIESKYELHNYNNAVEILHSAFCSEFSDIVDALDQFSITVNDLRIGGGNESQTKKLNNSERRQSARR